MSSEQIFIISILSSIATTIIAPIITRFLERRKVKSEEDLNIAQAAGDIIEGGDKAVARFERLLNRYEDKNSKLEAKIDAQSTEIFNLNTRLTAQAIDQREKESRWEAKFRAFEDYVSLLVTILRQHEIEIPPRPDVLKESQKVKAITPEQLEKK